MVCVSVQLFWKNKTKKPARVQWNGWAWRVVAESHKNSKLLLFDKSEVITNCFHWNLNKNQRKIFSVFWLTFNIHVTHKTKKDLYICLGREHCGTYLYIQSLKMLLRWGEIIYYYRKQFSLPCQSLSTGCFYIVTSQIILCKKRYHSSLNLVTSLCHPHFL